MQQATPSQPGLVRKAAGQLRPWLAPYGSQREWLGQVAARVLERVRRHARALAQPLVAPWGRRLPLDAPPDDFRVLQTRVSSSNYDVLCLPIIQWDYRFQRPQQLMRQFARHGHRVFYVSHDFLVTAQAALKPLEENLFELRLHANAARNVYRAVPSQHDVEDMVEGIARLHAAGCIGPSVVVVQLPFWTRVAERLRDRFGWPVVYDCMDDLAGFSTRASAMLAMEDNLLDAADVTVTSSEVLYHKAAARSPRAALVRNGVDYEHFARRIQAAGADDQTVIGYYGAISHWFDGHLMADLATACPQWRFQLIGDTFAADLTRLRRCRNVELLGEKPYCELPQLMAPWRACVVPFKRNPLTEATNPVKVYEMLAAGKPVVAVDLPELRPLARAGLVEIADDAAGFAARLAKVLHEQSPARIAQRRAFARRNTWDRRFRQFIAALEPCFEAASTERLARTQNAATPLM